MAGGRPVGYLQSVTEIWTQDYRETNPASDSRGGGLEPITSGSQFKQRPKLPGNAVSGSPGFTFAKKILIFTSLLLILCPVVNTGKVQTEQTDGNPES